MLNTVDFDQLKIQNQQFLEKVEERNAELIKLKLTAARTLQVSGQGGLRVGLDAHFIVASFFSACQLRKLLLVLRSGHLLSTYKIDCESTRK